MADNPSQKASEPTESLSLVQSTSAVYLCHLKATDMDSIDELLESINCSNVSIESSERLSQSIMRLHLTSPLGKRQLLSQAKLLKGHQRFGHVFIRDDCSKESRAKRDLWKAMIHESRQRGEEIPAAVVFDTTRSEYRLVPKGPDGKLRWKEDYRASEEQLSRAEQSLSERRSTAAGSPQGRCSSAESLSTASSSSCSSGRPTPWLQRRAKRLGHRTAYSIKQCAYRTLYFPARTANKIHSTLKVVNKSLKAKRHKTHDPICV